MDQPLISMENSFFRQMPIRRKVIYPVTTRLSISFRGDFLEYWFDMFPRMNFQHRLHQTNRHCLTMLFHSHLASMMDPHEHLLLHLIHQYQYRENLSFPILLHVAKINKVNKNLPETMSIVVLWNLYRENCHHQ